MNVLNKVGSGVAKLWAKVNPYVGLTLLAAGIVMLGRGVYSFATSKAKGFKARFSAFRNTMTHPFSRPSAHVKAAPAT